MKIIGIFLAVVSPLVIVTAFAFTTFETKKESEAKETNGRERIAEVIKRLERIEAKVDRIQEAIWEGR